MELLFIGTGAADWPANQPVDAENIRRMTCTLLDESTLLDCGPDSFGYYCYLGKDPAKITDILLSHAHGDHVSKNELEKLSMEALKQIDKKRYDLELKEDGIDNLIKLGIAFSGKKVVIKAR